MAKGYLRVGTLGGVDLRMHWTTPLAMLLWVLAFGKAGTWAEVSAVVPLIYLIHGLGHFGVARVLRFKVHRLQMGPMGVHAGYSGQGVQASRTWVAFGGVMAHGVLAMLLFLFPIESSAWTAAVGVNLVMGAVNLIPAGTLDGADGWPLATGRARRAGHRPTSTHPAATRARLVREVDAQIGHPPIRRPRPKRGQERQLSGDEPAVPPELVEQAELLMQQARRDAMARVRDSDGGLGPAGITEE